MATTCWHHWDNEGEAFFSNITVDKAWVNFVYENAKDNQWNGIIQHHWEGWISEVHHPLGKLWPSCFRKRKRKCWSLHQHFEEAEEVFFTKIIHKNIRKLFFLKYNTILHTAITPLTRLQNLAGLFCHILHTVLILHLQTIICMNIWKKVFMDIILRTPIPLKIVSGNGLETKTVICWNACSWMMGKEKKTIQNSSDYIEK